MGNRNKNIRIGLRWTHLLIGWLIGVLVYTPARENVSFLLLMQIVFVSHPRRHRVVDVAASIPPTPVPEIPGGAAKRSAGTTLGAGWRL